MHEGHRERLKRRFKEEGLNNFEAHNALELLLFYSIPRRDTNEMAHNLLQTFGSISKVFEANIEDLKKVDGIGKNTALLIKLVPSLNKLYHADKIKSIQTINSTVAAGEFFLPKFFGEADEIIIVVCLDNQGRILNCSEISHGTVNSTQVSNRKILELALMHRSTSIILAHNHPGGLLNPSIADIDSTINLVSVLESVQICLRDHIIVANDKWFSMADSPRFAHIFNY